MKFLSRSLLILLLLYGLVFAFCDICLVQGKAPLWLWIAFPVALISLQFLISPWLIEFFLDISFDYYESDVPAVCREFVTRLCLERGLKEPKIGVIQSGTPNAFSYGRFRSDASVVVTQGLLDVLTPEEVNAVLAHEIGHIEHYDFAVMSIAAVAPLILYQIYVFGNRINNTRAVAYGAYLCYLLSQFVVLLLNRTREYYADHYSAEVTSTPEALASALIKIAYGMINADGAYREALSNGSTADKGWQRSQHRIGSMIGIMGISNLNAGQSLALSGIDPAVAASIMRWDLTNPWARVYELNCSHPLTALRVRELNQDTEALHQHVRYPLPQEQQKNWAKFSLEFALWIAPWLTAFAFLLGQWGGRGVRALGLHMPPGAGALLLITTGVLFLLRIYYRYRGAYQDASIGSLLEEMEVSQMQPRAVRLKGTIVGRGLPGAFWSPDLVLRDSTGIVFLLYRQSVPFARLLFALTAADAYIGEEVLIEGWYRRGVRPYVEMSTLSNSEGITHRAFGRWVQYAMASLAIFIGFYWWTTLR